MIKRTSLFMTLLVAVGVTLVTLTVLSINVMSLLQACTSAESRWSKAQNESIYQLTRYAEHGQEDNYNQFLVQVRLPAGYHRSRLEMNKPEPDWAIARQGYLDGGVDSKDVDGMLTLYRYLKWQPDIAHAFRQWERADAEMAKLRAIGSKLQAGFTSTPPRLPGADVMTEITRINHVLKPLEATFSSALGDASRLLRNLLITGFSSIALLLIGSSLFLARRVGARSARLESQLRKSEERLTLGFIGSGAGLWDWDIRSDNVYYSPWISELLGYEEGMLGNAPSAFMEMMHPDDRAACQQAAALHFRESARYDVAFRLKTGDASYLWCRSRGQVVRDDNGIPVRMVGTLTDISDLKEAEALAFSEKELAQVALAAIADAVITTDIAGNITYCNRVAEALLGRTIASLRNRPLSLACRIFSETSGQQISDLVGPSIDGIDSVPLEDTLLLHRLDG